MDVNEYFYGILSQLPWPVSRTPAGGENETYLTFNETSGTLIESSGNEPQRLRCLVQVHAFSHRSDDTHRKAFFQAIALLRQNGVRVYSWGPDQYEDDTGIHHIAATCEWLTLPDTLT